MDYHKSGKINLRLSEEIKDKLSRMVEYYHFNSISDMMRNFITYSWREFQSPENFNKTAKMLSDCISQSVCGFLENHEKSSVYEPSPQTFTTLVKMIHDDFGDGILYRMCETKQNDIIEFLSVAIEPWEDIIQGKLYEKYKFPVRKEDVRNGLRIWFNNAVDNSDFKRVLEEYLTSKIAKKLSDKQKKDEL